MIKNHFLRGFTVLSLLILSISITQAETVKYPSLTQPGTAQLAQQNSTWVFSNKLFTASYLVENKQLLFLGSPELSIDGGTELFQIELGNGTKVKASQMEWLSIASEDLTGRNNAARYSEQLNGKSLVAKLKYNNLSISWRAILRDDSHYLRTELEISTTTNTPLMSITPMLYKINNANKPAPVVVGNTRGAVVASENIFAGVETPLAYNLVSNSFNPNFKINSWTPGSWVEMTDAVPSAISNLGLSDSQIVVSKGQVNVSYAGTWTFKFQYSSGTHRMNLTGIDLVNSAGVVVASDYHVGFTGNAAQNNSYTLQIPNPGDYTLRYFGETKTETITSSGNIQLTKPSGAGANDNITAIANSAQEPFTDIVGKWSRNTTLRTTDTFKVSTVIGMIAPGQKRRSFLSYHERERVVAWRSFVHYNSWYELNINRNNDSNPLNRMTETQCLPVLQAWKSKLFDKYGVSIDAFVWDDGWDNFNSLWDFHIGFPNGFANLSQKANEQGAGIGAWLGPVGGYGSSKAQRLSYWNTTYGQNITNFELSNKIYFDAFVNRCSQMVDDYDMRYFKFDGISDFFSATGPKNEEDAEGFINMVNALRKKREDIYINATVGTWASPFWFQVADAVWRQENDFGKAGVGDSREQWITYRDRLVHQNFVTNSPLCPINSLMTHGLIVTKYGPPNEMPRTNTEATYKGIVKEMRMAFASGSSLVELYLDNDLITSIGNGKLWGDLAESIAWHKRNKNVLADTHWIGGNPWNDSQAKIYGWAAWNGESSVITLRNPSTSNQTFTTTLRQILEIPNYVNGKIKLTNTFATLQTTYPNITNQTIDIDASITFDMPAFDVVVLDGIDSNFVSSIDSQNKAVDNSTIHGEIRKIIFKNFDSATNVQIIDMKGSTISNTQHSSKDFNIGVASHGAYIVKVVTDSGIRKTEKVIVF